MPIRFGCVTRSERLYARYVVGPPSPILLEAGDHLTHRTRARDWRIVQTWTLYLERLNKSGSRVRPPEPRPMSSRYLTRAPERIEDVPAGDVPQIIGFLRERFPGRKLTHRNLLTEWFEQLRMELGLLPRDEGFVSHEIRAGLYLGELKSAGRVMTAWAELKEELEKKRNSEATDHSAASASDPSSGSAN